MIKLRSQLLPALQYHIGSGEDISLWHDLWQLVGVLIQIYPRGPSITGLPLNAHLSSVILEGEWNWPPITSLEILDVFENLPLIHGGIMLLDGEGDKDTQQLLPKHYLTNPHNLFTGLHLCKTLSKFI